MLLVVILCSPVLLFTFVTNSLTFNIHPFCMVFSSRPQIYGQHM